MPRTRSLSWAELRIGVVTIIGVGITAVAIFLLTGDRGFFWQRYSLKTRFTNVAGLRPGSPVRVAGFDVGTVSSVEFVGAEVDVTFEVNQSMRERITTESTAYLGSVSLLGESAVDINPSTEGTPLPEWDYVKQGGARGQLADVAVELADVGELLGLHGRKTDVEGARSRRARQAVARAVERLRRRRLHDLQEGEVGGGRAQDLGGAVVGAVVHDHPRVGRARLARHRGHDALEMPGLVADRGDEQHAFFHAWKERLGAARASSRSAVLALHDFGGQR